MEFHHVGVATRNAATLGALYADLLGTPVAHEETVDGMTVTFLDCATGYVELLEPEDGGVIDDYLAEHGPGLHHLAFRADDLEGALARARELGIDMVDEHPRPGAWNHDVAFLHPGSTGGVLIEFVGG